MQGDRIIKDKCIIEQGDQKFSITYSKGSRVEIKYETGLMVNFHRGFILEYTGEKMNVKLTYL